MASRHGNRRFTASQEQQILMEYEAGASTPTLAKKWGVVPCSINRILRRNGATPRTLSESLTGRKNPHRHCSLDERAFDDAEQNPLAAYFAGLLFADGCITDAPNRQASLVLSLANQDGILVHAFREFLGSSHKVTTKAHDGEWATSTSTTTRLHISSDRLVAALSRYGVVPRKSLTACPAEAMQGNRDWWRGVVDGDGWVSLNKNIPVIGVVGSLETCQCFLTYANTVTATAAKPYAIGNIWMAKVNQCRAYQLALALYTHAALSLPRKEAAAQAIMAYGRARSWPLTGRAKTGPKT